MATIIVDRDTYKKSFYTLWKTYQNIAEGRTYINIKNNPGYLQKWKTIDSVYKVLEDTVNTKDTVFLSQVIFDNIGLRPLNDFANIIDAGQCVILDQTNQKQFLIIRRKGEKVTGTASMSTISGGRAYYLPGYKNEFFSVRDWIT